MRRVKTIGAALVLFLALGATTSYAASLPLPAFQTTFSAASLTRGYWFQAPVDFYITGLRVPDEIGFGTQNVELFLLGGAPPEFSSTTNTITSLFRSIGQPSAGILATNIFVSAGQYIGVLGATGDATIMHNSYGAGNFLSNIGGFPVTLTRLGMQSNLVLTPASNVFSESGGPIGRVEMLVEPIPEPATLLLLGTGLAAAGMRRRMKKRSS